MLVNRLQGPSLAMFHVGDRVVAEEVVQDVWVGVQQLDRFQSAHR